MSEHERQPAAPEDQNTVRQPEEQSAERQPEARNPEPQPEGKKGLGRKVKDGLSFFKGNFHKFESEDEPATKFGESRDPLARFTREYYERDAMEREDLAFMDEVDAALHRRGHPVA